MAVLTHVDSGIRHYLTPRHIVGRALSCHLCISERRVSGVHAEILWNGTAWQVQDLGSRNGTFVDGRRLAVGEQAALTAGNTLAIGGPGNRYALTSDAPPKLMAVPDLGPPVVAEDDFLCLPALDACEVSVFRDLDERWVIESEHGKRAITEQALVMAGGRSWRISLPSSIVQTRDTDGGPVLQLEDVRLQFAVSRDGEHVTVYQHHGADTTELEYRAHLFLLVELARCRLSDNSEVHLPESEHGWIHREDLLQRLGIDSPTLNRWVFRLRKQFVELGFDRAASIIQRRAGSQQLRIGVHKLQIDHA